MKECMEDIGTYKGPEGLERLFQEIRTILAHKQRVVVAIAGLPGAGKTRLVKRFVRLGFGTMGRKDIQVVDDNTIYSTKCWRLHWEKIHLDKRESRSFLESTGAKVVFFSNWIPSRFLGFADIYVILKLDEEERVKRLKRRERKAPEKFLVQKAKEEIPLEEPFECPRVMTLANHPNGMFRWHCMWAVRRWYSNLRPDTMKTIHI
ncbi:MAG TPA: AAA family ATPase [Syntrophales bacterium]|nr:AAA family ATPase [Syntrophales bacterium]HPQ43064.1 AAA family ATPase [Syntrophales bacterium]